MRYRDAGPSRASVSLAVGCRHCACVQMWSNNPGVLLTDRSNGIVITLAFDRLELIMAALVRRQSLTLQYIWTQPWYSAAGLNVA
jgi:hypothetical protein